MKEKLFPKDTKSDEHGLDKHVVAMVCQVCGSMIYVYYLLCLCCEFLNFLHHAHTLEVAAHTSRALQSKVNVIQCVTLIM